MTDPTAADAKLLPCPICGRQPQEYTGDRFVNYYCDQVDHLVQTPSPTNEIARRRWNTRRQPAPPAGEPDFEKLAEEIEDWMPDKSPGEMSHKEYIRQFAAFLKNRIGLGINSYPLSDDQIRYMVDRFLAWRLPKPWTPDNGISYARPNYMHAPADHDWPTGTNLFDWSQAEAMVRYMAEGLPIATLSMSESVEVKRFAELLRARVPSTIERADIAFLLERLAARPKVDDAEIVAHVALLRMLGCVGGPLDHAAVRKAADLLEDRAGVVSDQRDYIQRLERLLNEASNQRDSANDNLAEREAELAKADEVIWHRDRQADGLTMMAPNERNIERNESAAINRHAARQQQKDKP